MINLDYKYYSMKKILILPMAATVLLVSCKAKTTASSTENPDKVVGTSPSFTGKKKLTQGMIAEGKSLFDNSCAKCHDLPAPKSHNDEQWVGIMNAMAPKAKLNAKQSELVYDYITFSN